MTRRAVAASLGVSPAYVTALCSDTPYWPGRPLVLRIMALTKGAVTPNDFLPVRPASPPKQPVAAQA